MITVLILVFATITVSLSQITCIRVFRFSGFKKEIAKHFFCSFVHFKLLYEFQSWFTSL